MDGINGLCDIRGDRENYGYKTTGKAGRGASFKNDFDIFESYKNDQDGSDFNKCNPMSFLNGAIGGKRYTDNSCDGGFGGGSHFEGGGGGGYINWRSCIKR